MDVTEDITNALRFTKAFAFEYNNPSFGPAHLLKGILQKDVGLTALLSACDIDIYYIEEWADVRIEAYPKGKVSESPNGDNLIDTVFHEAENIALTLGRDKIDAKCIFISLCTPGVGFSHEQLKSFPVSAKQAMDRLGGSNSKDNASFHNGINGQSKQDVSSSGVLAKYCTDLMQFARNKKLDKFIGGDKEFISVCEVLCRRSKANIILTGDAGVGKTALVRGFAQFLSGEQAPEKLRNVSFFELDMSALNAGTVYKGELEDRFLSILNDLAHFEFPILFIDEINMLFDKSQNYQGIINLLRTHIARKTFTLIATTLTDEYRKKIEPEASFVRWFEVIPVSEPTTDQTVLIMEGIIESLSQHHDVLVNGNVICEAVRLCKRYCKERKLPDTVIDVLDRTMASLTMIQHDEKQTIEIQHVAATIAKISGIPAGKILAGERERLLNMEKHICSKVIGQDGAVKVMADAILESRSGLSHPGQPIGSFFLLGPTGTGKTELAKQLADFLFQSSSALIRFDMSEFKEEHSVALLYGSPPGYVGYEEGGLLVSKIKQQPYAVVLFDEIEKAHASVFDIFLQILDEGKIHDKLGRIGDFSNAVILFTSNIGSKLIVDSFAKNNTLPLPNELSEMMKPYFRPEFLGRLSGIVPFAPITLENVGKIIRLQLQELEVALTDQGIQLHISDEAIRKLATEGYTPEYGARPLRSVIRTQLKTPVSRMIISGKLSPGDHLNVWIDENQQLQLDCKTSN